MNKEVILTGIRANNDLHIGNYFGALLPIVDMAKKHSDNYQINLFIPDLHSFTTPIDHSQLQAQIMHNLKIFAAAGLPLDNDNIRIYRQSYIPAHSELTWILDCFTGFGEMRRMTQFKNKSKIQDTLTLIKSEQKNISEAQDHLESIYGDNRAVEIPKYFRDRSTQFLDFLTTLTDSAERENSVRVGLFNYPVLMAADILLYGAKYVPVGDDQTQHLEFTRDIATRVNNQFGDLFVVPEPVAKQHEFFGKDQGLRIRDLADPTKKMSKSDESDRGVIFMGDNPDDAAKKIKSATTDSHTDGIKIDFNERPGITNLIQIYHLLKPDDNSITSSASYAELKDKVAGAVKEFLTDFQAKLTAVDEQKLIQKLEADEKAMAGQAGQTLLKVQRALGLRPQS